MRFKITLETDKHTAISLNYQYALMSAIYDTLETGNIEYAKFLHEQGYQNQRRFKLFTFSNLLTNRFKVERGYLYLQGKLFLIISSPVQDFIFNLMKGFRDKKYLEINNSKFLISGIQVSDEPEYSPTMHYKSISPYTVSRQDENCRVYYLREYETEELEERLKNNILRKSEILKITDTDIKFTLPHKKKSKLIVIKEGRFDEIKVKSIISDVAITATPSLQRLCYEAGIGEKNSMGFGCLEIKKPR